jgi:hypothetical protein
MILKVSGHIYSFPMTIKQIKQLPSSSLLDLMLISCSSVLSIRYQVIYDSYWVVVIQIFIKDSMVNSPDQY